MRQVAALSFELWLCLDILDQWVGMCIISCSQPPLSLFPAMSVTISDRSTAPSSSKEVMGIRESLCRQAAEMRFHQEASNAMM